MNKKILWIIAFAFLTIYLFFWHSCVKPFDFSGLFESIDFFSALFTALIFSSVIALLISLIPFKNKNYKARLGFSFPISIILVSLLLGFNFYSAGPHYHAIKAETNSNCKSIHDGSFQCGDLLIERKGNLQIQTDVKTQEQERFAVTWLNDCEYQLNSLNTILKVKIVSVNQKGYDCYVWNRGRTSQLIQVNFK